MVDIPSFADPNSARAPNVRRALYESALRGVSARYRKLDRLDAFFKGLEYSHLEYDWNGMKADDVETISPTAPDQRSTVSVGDVTIPVRMRRPTAPQRLCPMIVNRFTGLLFSESRKPQIQVEADQDSQDFLQTVQHEAQFWPTWRIARSFGGAMGSVLVTVTLLDGAFAYEAFEPKYVQDIVWADRRLFKPAGVLIQYVTLHEYEEQDKNGNFTGGIVERPYLYRRIIDEEMDLVFKEAAIPEDGSMPDMEVDEEQTVRHNLGFFPGVWVQNIPNPSEIDGIPDCDAIYQSFDTIDRLLAQANRGTIANCDPTVVYGRDAKLEKAGVVFKGTDNAINVGIGGFANYMEITAAGILAARELAKELKQNALDKAQCVIADPEKISGAAQSAKAIEIIYAPMLEKTDVLRDQYGRAICLLSEITLEMARAFSQVTRYPGRKREVTFKIPDRVIETPNSVDPDKPIVTRVRRRPGPGGSISLKWGAYFSPTPSDRQMDITTISTAKQSELIDGDTAIEQAAPIFDLQDTAALQKKVREEKSARQASLLAGIPGYEDPGAGGFYPGDPGEIPIEPPVDELGLPVDGVPPIDGAPVGPRMPAKGGAPKVADETFNGAQFDSAITLLEKIGQKTIDPRAGAMLLSRGLRIPPDEAKLMAEFQVQMDLPPPNEIGGGGFGGGKPSFGNKGGDEKSPLEPPKDPPPGAPPA